jgi:predicted lipoprotein with Yx(FWY)xxD motif
MFRPMKSGATLWVGALSAALLAAASLHWLPHRHEASDAKSPAPVATPPGITLQLRTVSGPSSRAANGGVVYADAKGMTLYVFDKDTRLGKSTCTGDCARAWPPAVAAPSATQDGDWSLVDHADGTRQWAYRGAPLYRFADDKAIGDANGDGDGGGAWQVAAFHPGAGLALPDAIEVREIADAGGAGLVDSLGMTLYAFEGGARHPEPPCTDGGDCTRHWAPLEAPEIANPAGDFSAIARDDGITQWAYRGKPLYKFDGDQRAGDVNGIGADARFRVALIVRHFMPADATIRRSVELGDILTTAGGATLYERDRPAKDESHIFRESHGPPALGRSFGTTTCDENCARTWQPFTAPADALPCGYWDIAKRPDGRRQWVYKGYALYTYAADRPGDIRGNEIYDLVQVSDDDTGVVASGGRHAPPAGGPAAGVDPLIPAGGDVAGIGVGAMFWHAVVP